MIVCLCNALSESEIVTTAESSGAASVTEVYERLGCRPRCGRCVDHVRELLGETQTAAAPPPALGGLALSTG